MEAGEDARAARGEGPRPLALCVLCGLPAAGKSTLARALAHRLRRERRWAVGVVAYDDVMPDAFLSEADALPLPSRWKSLRQELLKDLECFLRAVLHGDPLSAPPGGTEALWEALVTCLRGQALLPPAAEGPSHCLPTPAASGPLLLILDDNFYYRSMRYEVYQLARKYSLGFCQLFLDCPLETCVQRNGQRPGALPAETIRLMGAKMEEPNPEKNAWEHNSLTVRSPASSAAASPELICLLLAALENPVNCVEDNAEQKETDRIICSTNTLHQADQTLRRIVSETMKEAKGVEAVSFHGSVAAQERLVQRQRASQLEVKQCSKGPILKRRIRFGCVSFLKIYFIPFSHVFLHTHVRNYGQQMGARPEAGNRTQNFMKDCLREPDGTVTYLFGHRRSRKENRQCPCQAHLTVTMSE